MVSDLRCASTAASFDAKRPSESAAASTTEFAAATLGTAAVFWVVLGAVFGWLNDRFAAAGQGAGVRHGARA